MVADRPDRLAPAPHGYHRVVPSARRVSRRSVPDAAADAASRRTVVIAMVANGVIAVAKLFAGLTTGSSAMLAETAHSFADTVNQAFLLVSLNLSSREPTPDRPFGHGQERFLWTLMAALGMFLAGAAFAVGYGTYELVHASESGGYGPAYVVLAVALVAEGTSWLRARRQTSAEAREAGRPLVEHVRRSRDPNVKMVLLEDSAALAGIALAAGGLGLHQLTGASAWDAGASILIGLMLMVVALGIVRDTRHMLVGAAAQPDERAAIERTIEEHPGITKVHELLTLVLGPQALLVAARVDLRNDLAGDEIEQLSNEIDERLRDTVPDVTEVFLDATP
jgi:cation diffusion facilitator family transporter